MCLNQSEHYSFAPGSCSSMFEKQHTCNSSMIALFLGSPRMRMKNEKERGEPGKIV